MSDRNPPAPPPPPDTERPAALVSEAMRKNRQGAAVQARGALVWMSPSGAVGEGPCVGPMSAPISTERIAALFATHQDAITVARLTGASLAQVWAAVWFELGCDSRRRFWM